MKARQKAYELLKEIMINDQYSNLLLRKELSGFNDLDKSFITQIVYGTLQNYRFVRYQWQKFVSDKLEEEISVLLDMTFYQLCFLDKIPAYACIDEAVEISKKVAHQKYTKLVNAVCRRFLRESNQDILVEDEYENLSILYSHPVWLVKMWSKQYGKNVMLDLLSHNLNKQEVSARVNTIKCSMSKLLEDKLFYQTSLSENGVKYDGNIVQTDAFKKGWIIIQDEASQLVAEFLNPQKNTRILDVCSAPGTKTSHMAAIMENQGEIIACDLHQHRLDLVDQSCLKNGVNIVTIKCLDARFSHENFESESFDSILVDAPCSGLGTIRHKADIKMRILPSDLDEIQRLQKEILSSVVNLLKIGGTLVYSTCTLNKKENEKQIEAFLKENSNYELTDEKLILGYLEETDGFYMAKLKRIA